MTADLDTIGWALTPAGATALESRKRTRAAALCWVRTLSRTGRTMAEQAHALAVYSAATLSTPLGLEARRWLERQSRIGDETHRRWAELLLGDLEE